MSRITILAVGKIKHPALKQLEKEYLDRLSHYTKCQIVEVKDSSSKDPKRKCEEESEAIKRKLSPGDHIVILDWQGKNFTSPQLAGQIQKINNQGISNTTFIIGGAYGLNDSIRKKANLTLSLSTLTLPHELARIFLLEQLYRAHTILRNEKYHH